MILTEEESKTKRCQEGYPAAYGLSDDGKQSGPIASHASGVATYAGIGGASYAVYSQPHGGAPINCLGSACMAWRWFDNLDDEAIKTPRGYCGKAGAP